MSKGKQPDEAPEGTNFRHQANGLAIRVLRAPSRTAQRTGGTRCSSVRRAFIASHYVKMRLARAEAPVMIS